MAIPFQTISFPLVGGVDTKVHGIALPPPRLQIAENCYAARPGALTKRMGFDSLSSTTVDNGTIGTTPAALWKYRDSLLYCNQATHETHEYSPTVGRWSERGSCNPGPIYSERIAKHDINDQVLAADVGAVNGYTLYAYVASTALGTGATEVRVTLVDSYNVKLCHGLKIWTESAGGLSGYTTVRVVALGTRLYVFFHDNANRLLKCWIVDTTSAATITTAIGTFAGASSVAPAASVTVDATPLHAAGVAIWDAVASGANGVFLAYHTSTAATIKMGFVSTAGTLGSTHTFTTASATDPELIAVAVGSASTHGVAFKEATGNDLYAVHKSWNGAAWSTLIASAALDATADPENLVLSYDSATVMRLWYTSVTTTGTAANDTARNVVYQTTYSTTGTTSARVSAIRRSYLVSRPFTTAYTAAGQRLYWVASGIRITAKQSTYHLILTDSNNPEEQRIVGWAVQGLAGVQFKPTSIVDSGLVDGEQAYVGAFVHAYKTIAGVVPIGVLAGGTYCTASAVSWVPGTLRAHRVEEVGGSLYLAGGMLQQYDGAFWTEAGFHRSIEIDTVGVTPSAVGGSRLTLLGTYYYRFVYEWEDAQGGRHQGTDDGPLQVVLTGANDTVTLDLPTLIHTLKVYANSYVFPVSKMVVAVYRTEANPATADAPFHRVGQVSNVFNADSVTFVDTLPDSVVELQERLYLDGGELDHVPPPSAPIMCQGIGRVFVAGLESDPHQIRYSLLRVGGEPLSFADELTIQLPEIGGPIVAMAVMNEALVVWCRHAIYRVRGTGAPNTGGDGFLEAELITRDIGCISQRSVVVTPFGCMFQDRDLKIHLLDAGYNVTYIGAQLEHLEDYDSDSALTEVNGAVHLPSLQQVRFTASARMWIYDYFNKLWSVYTDQGISGPSCEWANSGVLGHTWAGGVGVKHENSGTLFTAADMRIRLAWVRTPSNFQSDMRVRRFGLVGQIDGTSCNLKIQVCANYSQTVLQTLQEVELAAGGLIAQWRTGAGARVVSSIQLEIDDNSTGADGTLTLSEIQFDVGMRGRGISQRTD